MKRYDDVLARLAASVCPLGSAFTMSSMTLASVGSDFDFRNFTRNGVQIEPVG